MDFLFRESRISEYQVWEPLCLPETLRYFSLRERIVAAVRAEWSAVSMRAALGHAETAQLSGSGAQCSARHLLIRWCLSSTRCLQNVTASRAYNRAFPPLIFQSGSPQKGFCLVILQSWESLIFLKLQYVVSVYMGIAVVHFISLTVSVLRCWKKGVWRRLVSTLSDSFLKILMKKTEKGISKWKAIPHRGS